MAEWEDSREAFLAKFDSFWRRPFRIALQDAACAQVWVGLNHHGDSKGLSQEGSRESSRGSKACHDGSRAHIPFS